MVVSIIEYFNQFLSLIEKVTAGNEVWHFAASLAILFVGFLALEISWRFSNRKIAAALDKTGYNRWVPYFSGFLPSLRLAVAALLLRAAELPLVIPKRLVLQLHGLETVLLAIALMLFLFQVIRSLEYICLILPASVRKNISDRALKNLKGILRVSVLVVAAIFFVYTQKDIFPAWILQSAWWRYVSLLIVFAILYVGGKLLTSFLETMTAALRDTVEKTRLRLILRAAMWPIRFLLIAIAIYAFQEILILPQSADTVAETFVNVLGTIVIVIFLYRLLDIVEYELTKFVRRDDNEFDMNFVQMVRIVSKVLVVVFGMIYLLKAATGKPMTTLLAGLGIGGLAVALAAQDTLKNLFGSFMLMIDKPFVVGDWIYVDGTHATVEEIGFRSTRIRTFSGHVISIPNEKMATMSIENVQRRPYVRRNMNVTITYDTPPDKVEKAVSLIKNILKDRPELHPDYPARVHFNEFNDMSLNIIVAYWFRENNHWESIAFNEKINFEIMRAFEAEGIEFAFPTTTTYLAQDTRRPLHITIQDE